MKMSKHLLIGVIGFSLSIPAAAVEFKYNVLQAAFVEPAKVTQLQAYPEELNVFNQPLVVITDTFVISDYGAGLTTEEYSPTLISAISYVANTAKMQNLNFQRQQYTF